MSVSACIRGGAAGCWERAGNGALLGGRGGSVRGAVEIAAALCI